MPPIKQYTLRQAQDLVEDAKRRMKPLHEEWEVLERLLESGSVEDFSLRTGMAGDEVATLLRERLGAAPETVNLVLPHVNIILASVIDRDPRLVCEPLRGGQEQADRALVAQALINYYWRRTHATEALRDATQDMVVCGNGFLKVGWNYIESTTAPMSGQDRQMLLDTANALTAGLPQENASGISSMVDLVEAVVEADEPFVSYVSPYDVFVPADARRMTETRWVAQRLRLPLNELLAREDLKNLNTVTADEQGVERAKQMIPSRGTDTSGSATDVFAMAVVYEFYDMRTRRMLVFQENSPKPLYDGPIPYGHRYPPFIHIPNFRARGDEFWAFGELRNVAPLQMAYNEVIREQLANFRRSGQKYLVSADMVTAEVEDALMSDIPDLVVKVDVEQGRPMSELIMPVFRAPLAQDTYAAGATMRDSISTVLGINDFQAGGSGADRMSATAAAVVDGVATLRAQDKIAAVERAASQTGNLLLRLAQEFISPDTAVSIVGSDGGYMDARIRQDMIDGEFDVSVEGGSTQAVNPATKQRRALDRLNMLVPVMQNAGYDVEPLLRTIIADFDLDPNQVLRRMPPPAMPGMPAAGGMPAGPSHADPAAMPLEQVAGLNADARAQGGVIL